MKMDVILGYLYRRRKATEDHSETQWSITRLLLFLLSYLECLGNLNWYSVMKYECRLRTALLMLCLFINDDIIPISVNIIKMKTQFCSSFYIHLLILILIL